VVSLSLRWMLRSCAHTSCLVTSSFLAATEAGNGARQ
jgi:hypothetical protein